MPLLHSNQKILLPAKRGFIAASFLVAFIFNLLPWPDVRGVPDLVALVTVFWCIHQPRRVGISIAWICGLLMDTADGVLIGQHALGYAVMAFMANSLTRRILQFPLGPQTLHVLVILVTGQALMLGVRMIGGGTFPGWSFMAGPLIAAALWPIATLVLLAPQRAAQSVDETRPI